MSSTERSPDDRRHLERLYDLSTDILCVVGPDGALREANPAFERVLGHAVDEVGSSTLLELTHPDDVDRAEEKLDRVCLGETVSKFQVRMVDAAGETLWIEWSASPGRDEGVVYAVGRDVTETKEFEAELRRSEEVHRLTLENVSDAVFVSDDWGDFTYVCPNVDVIFGYEQREVEDLGNLAALLGEEFVEDEMSGEWRERTNIEWEITDASGTGHTVLVNLKRVAIRGGTVLTVCRDITDRVELEDRLQQAQRLEAVGRLAGGVAHDFNNVLTTIQGFATLLHDEAGLDPAHAEDLDEIRRAVDRASSLVEKLLAVGRRQTIEFETVDPGSLIRELEPTLRSLVPESIDLEVNVASELPRVRVDPEQIERVLLNLVLNAVDALPDGGRIGVRCRASRVREPRTFDDVTIAPGRYLTLSVWDTGVGMDDETIERIFEPFFTTKEANEGTGLGLASVYGTIKQHGGMIEVESRPGEGSVFEIVLPTVDGGEAGDEGSPSTDASREISGDETILLVEDSRDVRKLAARALQRQGYAVLEASRPSEAMTIAEGHGDEISLVLTDVILPEMSGFELADRLAEMGADPPILYMSGYTDATVPGHAEKMETNELLRKPFRPDELVRRVRELLDR